MADGDKIRIIPNNYRHYKPLDMSKKEIRLLRILPAESPRDKLVCCLVRTDLDDCPPYHALSYAWGSLDDTIGIKLILGETLYVDSSYPNNSSQEQQEDEKTFKSHEWSVVDNFQITTNLHAGLRSFLINKETNILIWADMICMNQSDLSERSHQVGFMHQVFSRATRVIAWLGGDPESPSDIFCGQMDALTTLLEMSGVHGVFTGLYPSKEELTAFTADLRNHANYTELLETCLTAKSMHPAAVNRQSIINVVDLYIAFIYGPKMFQAPENETTAAMLQCFFDLGSLLDRDTYVWQFLFIRFIAGAYLQDPRSVRDHFDELLLRGEVKSTLQDRIGSLFNLPWFRRIWVIQEVTLNPKVYARHCNSTAPWNIVEMCAQMATIEWADLLSIKDLPGVNAMLGTHADISPFWFRGRKPHYKICELLTSARDFEATVPRDKLYAIYHLAADLPNLRFFPDYKQSLQATYATFTLQVVQATGSLEILSFAGRLSAPKTWTWVPEYHQLDPYRSRRSLQSLPSDSASLRSQARLYKSIYTLAEEAIILRGVHFADVSCIVQPQKPISFPAVWQSLQQQHERICRGRRGKCMDDHSEGIGLSMTDFLDLWTYASNTPVPGDLRSTYAAFWIGQEPDLVSLLTSPTNQSILRRMAKDSDFVDAMFKVYMKMQLSIDELKDTCPFLTQAGSLGLGPPWAKVGDLVVTLDGGHSTRPFLLRPINTPATTKNRTMAAKRGQEFQLVGNCYLQGAMHGDIFESPRWSDADPLYEDPMDYDPGFTSPGGGKGYSKGFY
ncbi:hypothetical protein LTS15_006287 [Exophiala xenobiotica]|nr:hypothetical protein LTS15_006287 [Exophiala xenobiotica]